ncbi:nucleotidyltransferase domain-containing protein [Paractinoplanes atraurantiacus]|uniref:Nucleotidyltransferase domain-containing protein n=1 Tax=Paractinoplanes atraurantiacus TaxID=1036182 RepID=A0A285F4Q3_9ACTN|nr:nucleotidyltransferase domain-containing protein [Actinoplanes atraurantiacus]SNY06279.1 Nucleotidyltransferase domain-containing protein [Actinoplanes atraurantiacus]
MALTDAQLAAMAAELIHVPGIAAVALGGSRARGTHRPDSDTDLGLYYQQPLDVDRLTEAARAIAGPSAQVTAPGGWGPWVDGGGWLEVDGDAVDLIYRDLDRVTAVCEGVEQGRYAFHTQAGHPLGFADHAYAGEVALAQVLADPSGELEALRRRLRVYPPALSRELVAGLWEADFLIMLARKGITRGDSAYVSGCLFRLAGVCAHALHGAAGHWLINEKGAVAAAAALPGAPAHFAERVDKAFAAVDGDPLRLRLAIDIAADLVLDTADACTMMMR